MIFLSPGDVEGENCEKLEFDDLLNEHAMFLRSQGLQHEAKMEPIGSYMERKWRSKRAQMDQTSIKNYIFSGVVFGVVFVRLFMVFR